MELVRDLGKRCLMSKHNKTYKLLRGILLIIEPTGTQIPQSPGFPGLKKDAERIYLCKKVNK